MSHEENRYAVYRTDEGVWMRSHAVHHESAARTVAQAAMLAAGLDVNDFRLRDRVIAGVSSAVNAMLDSVQVRRDYLESAIDAGGWDLSPCGMCGTAVVCLPDGLPLCEDCARKESE